MTKRILCLVLIMLIAILACGCGNEKTDKNKEDVSSSQNDSSANEQKDESKTDNSNDETTPQKEELTTEAFCAKFEGTWTASDGSFIDFAFEDNKPTAFFAIWQAGGYFPGGIIKSVEETKENEYTMEIFFPGVEATDMYDAVESYTESFTVINHNDGNITVSGTNETKKYFYDGRMQFPMES
ncbi:MAG: hypothetical protein E7562_01210 [Ruminococcaceae bacterium]|nr:hypothetical protein [Oscillospiraceae bacterium]